MRLKSFHIVDRQHYFFCDISNPLDILDFGLLYFISFLYSRYSNLFSMINIAKFFPSRNFFIFFIAIFKMFLFVYFILGICWIIVAACELFSSCSKCRLPSRCHASASHCGGFSYQSWAVGCAGFRSCHTWTQQLWFLGSGALAQWLWCRGLISLLHEESFCNRDQTHVSRIAGGFLTS